jgi:cell wall-associated NlpC family hydrolase
VAGNRGNEQTPHRSVLALVFIASLLLLMLSGSSLARASTPAIDQTAAEVRALATLLDQLSNELSAATEDYNYANQQAEDTQAAAKKTSLELTQAERDLALAQDQLDQRVVNIYKAGNVSLLGVILDVNSFSELIAYLDQFARLSAQDGQTVDQVRAYRAQAADQKAKLESELQQQQNYAAQAAAARQVVLSQVAKQKQALKGKEAQLAQLRKEEAARQARLAAEARAAALFAASRPGRVIKLAMQYLGVPYVWAGADPSGFDCSGLVLYCYAKVGVSLPHSSRMQYGCGTPVARGDLKPGDLVFFGDPIHHVGLYIGNGKMINATGNQVQISGVWESDYHGACRLP